MNSNEKGNFDKDKFNDIAYVPFNAYEYNTNLIMYIGSLQWVCPFPSSVFPFPFGKFSISPRLLHIYPADPVLRVILQKYTSIL